MSQLINKLNIKKKNPIFVTAHRGARAECPENTLLAFKTAIDIGADFIEMDIRTTKDNQIVIMHDDSTRRVSNMDLVIADNTYEALKEADLTENQTIPLLSEVFEQCKGKTGFVIEIKSAGLVEDLLELINTYDVADSSVIISFKHKELVDFRKINQSIPIASLHPVGGSFWNNKKNRNHFINEAIGYGFEGIHVMHNFVNKKFVEYAHEKDLFVNPWTADSPIAWTRLIKAGVDGISTNYSRELIKKLKKFKK